MAITGDFLEAQELIIARLQDATLNIGFKAVLGSADIQAVLETQQIVPAAHVLSQGYQAAGNAGRGKGARLNQAWQIIVAAKNVRSIKSTETASQDAGPFVTKVIQALAGWKPSTNHGEMQLITPGGVPGYSQGFIYIPVGFTTEIAIIGTD
jgi:hypothetical protein